MWNFPVSLKWKEKKHLQSWDAWLESWPSKSHTWRVQKPFIQPSIRNFFHEIRSAQFLNNEFSFSVLQKKKGLNEHCKNLGILFGSIYKVFSKNFVCCSRSSLRLVFFTVCRLIVKSSSVVARVTWNENRHLNWLRECSWFAWKNLCFGLQVDFSTSPGLDFVAPSNPRSI